MNKIFMGTFLVFALVLTAFSAVPAAEAKQDGNNTFPGNSLFGRMHNPHFMYKWGNQNFEDFDDLIEYIREYLYKWRLEKGTCTFCDKNYSTQINVVTRSAIDVDEDSATLRGKIVLDEDEAAEIWFEYGTTFSNLSEETEKREVDDEDDSYFSEGISDLDADTRYYYRAVAEDEDGDIDYGSTLYFITDEDGEMEETPSVTTRAPNDITADGATFRGRVEMNDFENGIVFFVYGTDEDMIDDVDNDYNTYADIDEADDDLQKVQVDNDLDGSGSYTQDVEDLDGDTTYYYRIGVQYEDEDADDTLKLGSIRVFKTE